MTDEEIDELLREDRRRRMLEKGWKGFPTQVGVEEWRRSWVRMPTWAPTRSALWPSGLPLAYRLGGVEVYGLRTVLWALVSLPSRQYPALLAHLGELAETGRLGRYDVLRALQGEDEARRVLREMVAPGCRMPVPKPSRSR